MKFKNNALAINENPLALVLSSNMADLDSQNFSVVYFKDTKSAKEHLDQTDILPHVIFCDYDFPGIDGMEFLTWCKRNPKIHQLPFVFLTRKPSIKDMTNQGVFELCPKPLKPSSIESVFKKVKKKFILFSQYDDLETSFIDETYGLVKEMKNILSLSSIKEKEIEEIFRIFHTIKGVSASLDYQYLAQFLHQGENFLMTIIARKTFSHDNIKKILQHVHHYLLQTLDCLKNKKIMPLVPTHLIQELKKPDDISYSPNKEYYPFLTPYLSTPSHDISRAQSLELLNAYAQKIVQELSHNMKKKCLIVFHHHNISSVEKPIFDLFKIAFTHLLRNALDHAIEMPQERVQAGKSENGLIEIFYKKKDNNTLEVKIEDNGRGIITSELKKILLKKNILQPEQINNLNDLQLKQMIFREGISTKKSVSDISGRGIGLSIVEEEVKKRRGNIAVTSQEGSGTQFIITLPLTPIS